MKKLVLALALFSTSAMAATDVVVHRDPGCGCCEKWAAMLKTQLGRSVWLLDDTNRASYERQTGVPSNLAGCHTAVIDGYTFEGHVPFEDMKRLLRTKPSGVRGLAVAGMPSGSPGMEMPGPGEHYNVIAFGSGPQFVFARH